MATQSRLLTPTRMSQTRKLSKLAKVCCLCRDTRCFQPYTNRPLALFPLTVILPNEPHKINMVVCLQLTESQSDTSIHVC